MAPPLNPGQARTVDPVLTQVARGYRNAAHGWMYLFPAVPVGQRAGKIIKFGAEQFAALNSERAPGATRHRVHFGHSDEDFALVQRAEDGVVPIETLQEAAAVPGINYSRVAVVKTMDVVSLQIEIGAAKLATRPGTYRADNKSALAGAGQWSHEDSRPAAAVETAKETIATGVGVDPNVMLVGPPVHRALVNHPDVIDRVKHTEGLKGSAEPVVNEAKLAQYFDVPTYRVARARTGKPGSFKPIWGKVAILAYVDVSNLASMGSPSYGYTYRLEGYPVAEPGWYDKTCDSWIYPVTTEDTPVVAGADAGYLFSDVVP